MYAKYCDTLEEIEESDEISRKGRYIEVSKNTPKIIERYTSDKGLSMAMQFDTAYLSLRKSGLLPGHYHNFGVDKMKRIILALNSPE